MNDLESVHPKTKDVTLFLYLYQPCMVSMALYAWAFDHRENRRRWIMILGPVILLALSEVEITQALIELYPAALLLPLFLIWGRWRVVPWTEVLTSALLGGLIAWRAADGWPLLSWLPLLCAGLMLIPVTLLCRSKEDRWIAVSLGGIFFELFFCLKEYMLFSFCVIRLGSRDGLSLSTASILLCSIEEGAYVWLRSRRKQAVSMSN